MAIDRPTAPTTAISRPKLLNIGLLEQISANFVEAGGLQLSSADNQLSFASCADAAEKPCENTTETIVDTLHKHLLLRASPPRGPCSRVVEASVTRPLTRPIAAQDVQSSHVFPVQPHAFGPLGTKDQRTPVVPLAPSIGDPSDSLESLGGPLETTDQRTPVVLRGPSIGGPLDSLCAPLAGSVTDSLSPVNYDALDFLAVSNFWRMRERG